jgi:uncharacterized protein YcbK (DUF882 family)
VIRLAVATSILLAAAPALADDDGSEPLSKKDQYWAEKQADPGSAEDRQRWQRTLDQRIGKAPAPVINIYNTWTHEFLAVNAGTDPDVPQDTVNRFLRCHFTNEPATMDARLFSALVKAANHFNSDRIDIVSGYRAPKYNLILRKKGRQVARNSQHTHGSAVDFRVHGVSVDRLHRWARGLGLGGVGYYPSSGFIHIDTDRVRYWTGN